MPRRASPAYSQQPSFIGQRAAAVGSWASWGDSHAVFCDASRCGAGGHIASDVSAGCSCLMVWRFLGSPSGGGLAADTRIWSGRVSANLIGRRAQCASVSSRMSGFQGALNTWFERVLATTIPCWYQTVDLSSLPCWVQSAGSRDGGRRFSDRM